jgi:hypothetical protein
MTFSFNLNVNDWVAFQQYHRGRKIPFYNAVYPLIIGMCIALVAINIGYHIHFQTVSNVTWVSGACFLTLLYILYIRKKSLDNVRKAGLEIEKKNPEAFGLMSLNTDSDGITILSRKASKTIFWKEMDRFEENKYYFFLYSKKGVVYIVPKREMEDQDGFRNELTNYIEIK